VGRPCEPAASSAAAPSADAISAAAADTDTATVPAAVIRVVRSQWYGNGADTAAMGTPCTGAPSDASSTLGAAPATDQGRYRRALATASQGRTRTKLFYSWHLKPFGPEATRAFSYLTE